MQIVLVATLHALAGRTDEIVDAVERLRRASETSPGCESFQAGRGLQDPTEFVVVSTWRDELKVHPRGDLSRPQQGVFSTRSPDRPNPIGLHRVRVVAVEGGAVGVDALEAVDGTPVLDLKPVLGDVAER
jgi:tRNA (Thr-GGU) A37 N-methylase